MDKDNISKIVINTISDYYDSQDFTTKVNLETVLFGNESFLDSMGLVSIVIDIESAFLNKGIEISLTSEKAMSVRNSPFRTISTLADFIFEQISKI